MLKRSLSEVLCEVQKFLKSMDAEAYCKLQPKAYNASIGKHIRHSCDHVNSLLQGIGSGLVDYDRRDRNTLVERNLDVALNQIGQQLERWNSFDESILNKEVRVKCLTCSSDSAAMYSNSTVGREVMFVVSHFVHHNAMIGMICQLCHIATPPGFGVAPSTLDYERSTAQAV